MHFRYILYLILGTLLFSSCDSVGSLNGITIEKRKFRSGWYINANSERTSLISEKSEIKQPITDSSNSSQCVASFHAEQSEPLNDTLSAIQSGNITTESLYPDQDSSVGKETHERSIIEIPQSRHEHIPPQKEAQGRYEAQHWVLLILGILFAVGGALIAVSLAILGGGIFILFGIVLLCQGALMIALFIIHGSSIPKNKKTRLVKSLTLIIFLYIVVAVGVLYWLLRQLANEI